ncbi:CLUMA_CG017601, isoform A [Clunio marinus]|uniref:CLUMA_CG017601, isoform A n=1 Tax=Clunio marinus TaxID=568069 RepID=A0A1J1IZC9_9DIPT|nr:CLUMA_CG017601, isoform A [Clunio marinus]
MREHERETQQHTRKTLICAVANIRNFLVCMLSTLLPDDNSDANVFLWDKHLILLFSTVSENLLHRQILQGLGNIFVGSFEDKLWNHAAADKTKKLNETLNKTPPLLLWKTWSMDFRLVENKREKHV